MTRPFWRTNLRALFPFFLSFLFFSYSLKSFPNANDFQFKRPLTSIINIQLNLLQECVKKEICGSRKFELFDIHFS